MLDVYSALKNRAASGRFVRAELISKINTMWAEDEISDAQRAELIGLVEANHDPEYSPLSRTEQELVQRVAELEAQVEKLRADAVTFTTDIGGYSV
jgi:hypothetical protein